MSYNSGNVNVMKEAVNALPIMKEVIEKVPLMEQVASEGTGSGILNTSSNGSGNMPKMTKMPRQPKGTMMPSIVSPDYNGALPGYKPEPRPGYMPAPAVDNSSDLAPAPYMIRKPVGKMTPMGYGYPVKTAKPAKPYVNPVNPYGNPIQVADTQGIKDMGTIQNSINNNIIQPLNQILSSIGEQPIPFKTVMYGGGDDDDFDEGQMVRAPKMAKVVKRPGMMIKPMPKKTLKAMKPIKQTQQQKMINIRNAILNNMPGIKAGIERVSNQLPCQPCESSVPEDPPQEQEYMEGGGRRSGTRRSRMKKSKKTLRNRRS